MKVNFFLKEDESWTAEIKAVTETEKKIIEAVKKGINVKVGCHGTEDKDVIMINGNGG